MNVKNVYVDSNIFLNVWFEEMIKYGQIFYSSKKLLDSIIDCKFRLVISDLTVRELSRRTNLPDEIIVNEYMNPFEMVNKLTIIKITKKIAEDASYFSGSHGVHITDAIHAMVAKSSNSVLVTRDGELRFAARKYGVDAFLPEELI